MKILICGHRSFAAQQLPQALEAAGHEVVCFSRGPVKQLDNVVTGPIDKLHENPLLEQPFDAVINYILLKDDTIERNIEYVDSLLRFCAERQIPHLIQIASISSFKSSLRVINEGAELETDFERKGSYGSIKAASDHRIATRIPKTTKLSLVHAGFILAPGMVHPFIGTGVRMPWNRLLALGNARSRFPVISRDILDEALVKLIETPPEQAQESLLLVDDKSPTRKAYLEACCTQLGCGTGVDTYHEMLWWLIAVFAEGVARAAGKADKKPYLLLTSKLAQQQFNSRQTQKRLGMSLKTDWKNALRVAVDGQESNFKLPYSPAPLQPVEANRVTYVGYGRIVKTRHVPALRALNFEGEIKAYDLQERDDEEQHINAIEGAQLPPSDLYVVATPGPVHTSAIAHLEQISAPVLVEKPLCYNPEDLTRWEEFAATREAPVFVCHNYRYKANVAEMLRIIERYNPGQLRHVSVQFDSPSVSMETAVWARNERRARTLLMDYGIHFLDVACLFGRGPWNLDTLRYELNNQGQTSLIEGRWAADNYAVAFLLRQGFGPRRAQVLFNFQNYSVNLNFFPETCVAHMADENAWLYKQEAKAWQRGFFRKVGDLLRGGDSDNSHALLVGSILNGSKLSQGVEVPQLRAFYEVLFETSRRVYEE